MQVSLPPEKDVLFEGLFKEHWERIYRILVQLCGDGDLAEDLALETFVRLWQQPPQREENLAGWLYRVAVNQGYNALRAGRRRRTYESGAQISLNNPAVDPAIRAEEAEQQRRIRQVLLKMEPRRARLLSLRSAGLTYREIAGALQLTPASVGVLLNRAEEEFEKLYGSDNPTP